jgi:hypothetical protein
MTRLRRAVGIGAIVIATMASALPAQAATKIDGTFDTVEQKGYSGGGALGNGWYFNDYIVVGSPPAAEQGTPVPSAPSSARLSQVTCFSNTYCQRTAGTLRTVVQTTPGRTVTVRLLAAAGHASKVSEIGLFGYAQAQPNVAADPEPSSQLEGSSLPSLGRQDGSGLKWQQLEWKLRTTSAYTLIMITPATGATLWVDDISLRCGS